ncbi:MAG TPA: type III pantothenate kinase [Steroidobacteraceae bacterium]|nr:type III pantothenate kinase [Steroidobacteraceae bacterium]
MILLLDVGNTRVKWAWLEYLEIAPAGAVAHDATRRSWQREIEADGHRPSRIVVASVAGHAFAAALTLWSRDHYRVEPEFVTACAELCGVRNAYARPTTLGVDRWLALIAAWRSERRATVIVNSGTALAVDTLDRAGRHCGGLIVPGAQMMREARARFDGNAELLPAATLPGTPVPEALPDCVLLMLASLVDRSVEELRAQVGVAPRVLLTGGDASLVEPYLRHGAELVPDLVLTGLAIVATRGAADG